MNIEEIILKIQQDTANFVLDRRKTKTISFSQLSIYSNCEFKWRLQYIDKAPNQPPTINLFFGTSVHNVLQKYLTVYKTEGKKAANSIDLEYEFEEEFIKNYEKTKKQFPNVKISNKKELLMFLDQGINIILSVVNDKNNVFGDLKNLILIGCEIPLLYPLTNNVFFEGYIDILFFNKATQKFVIIDLKTSGKGWSNYDKNDKKKIYQLYLYKYILSKKYSIPFNKIWSNFTILIREAEFGPTMIDIAPIISDESDCSEAFEEIIYMSNNCFDKFGNRNPEINYKKKKTKIACNFCHFKDTSYCTD